MADRARGSVFINCPFDEAYKPDFDAITFTILACGFLVRSALELSDSGELRLDKIYRLIDGTSHCIHDLSRVETDRESGLPRFNMPIELGIALGHRRFCGKSRRPRLLILDRERFRYQRFASDLAGLDISEHRNEPAAAIAAVRHFLTSNAKGLPTPDQIAALYLLFEGELPDRATANRQSVGELNFLDRLRLAQDFVEAFVP